MLHNLKDASFFGWKWFAVKIMFQLLQPAPSLLKNNSAYYVFRKTLWNY